MKILSLGLDKNILDKNSAVAKRLILYSGLAQRYTVMVPSDKDVYLKYSEKADVNGVGAGFLSRYKSISKAVCFFRLYKKAKKVLLKGFDVITVQDQYYLGLIGLFLAGKFKIGLELQIHGFEKYSGFRKMAAKYIIPRAGAVRCVSQRLKKQMMDEFGVREEKITVAPIFTESQSGEQGARKQKEKFVFLTVGRLAPVKNIGMQIRALAEVVKKFNNLELWIIGDGPERKKLEAESKKLAVEKIVKFLGWQDSLERYYNQADVFLLTSNSEGWGLAAVEAAGCGLPIIMTDVGCAGELIINNESGLIIPVGSQSELEKAIIKLVEDERLREGLGQNAKEAIKKLPDQEEILGLYKVSLKKALKKAD